jgi:hypothetical protein
VEREGGMAKTLFRETKGRLGSVRLRGKQELALVGWRTRESTSQDSPPRWKRKGECECECECEPERVVGGVSARDGVCGDEEFWGTRVRRKLESKRRERIYYSIGK